MLLTIRDVSEELVAQAKTLTGKGTGSQAFIAGIEMMLKLRERVDQQREEISRLEETVAVYRQTLMEAHTAAVRLAEVAGQGDLLLPSSNPLRPGYRPNPRLRHHLEG